MKVIFESPESALDENGNKIWPYGFNPNSPEDFKLIPNLPGVYIIGVKVDVNGKDTFFPLYVGETGDGTNASLNIRLKKHYDERSKIDSKSTKEIFDLSDISKNYLSLYNSLEAYNDIWIFNPVYGGSKKKHNLYSEIRIDKNLIYFQCSSQLNYKLNLDVKTSFWKDINHNEFYNFLNSIRKTEFKKLLKKYIDTKYCVENNFYFSYCILPENNTNQRQVIEAQVKYQLKKLLKIFTSSDVTVAGKNEWKRLNDGGISTNLYDLSAVQNSLINLTGISFQNPLEI